MTQKSRRRKARKKQVVGVGIKTYRFFMNQKEVHISAPTMGEARSKFQERFGQEPA